MVGADAHAHAQGVYLPIAVGLIDASATNPRKTFDEAKLGELAESMQRLGLQQPIVVRQKRKRYEIVAGERRWRAAKLAEWTEIPAIVRELTDTEALEVQVIENDQRADVHPLEQMDGYQRLLDQPEYAGDRKKLAERIGKSVSFVHQRLKLGDAIDEVKEAFRAGRIKSHHASMIAREGAKEQKALLRDLVSSGWSVRELQEEILRRLRRDVRKGGFRAEDADLLKGAPACSACPRLSGNCADLYPEIASKTVCTDRGCYEKKQAAHVKKAIAAAADAGEPLAQISERCYSNQKGVLAEPDYTKIVGAVKACESTKKAIVVEGDGLGKIVKICASKSCKTHHRGSSFDSASDVQRREKEREEKRAAELTRVVCGRIVDRLLDALSTPPAMPLEQAVWWQSRLEEWTEHAWGRLWNDLRRLVQKRHPEWDADVVPIGDLLLPELVRFANELALAKHLMVSMYGEKGVPADLRALCEENGIDWQAIESEVKTEIAAKGKKGGKAKAAKGQPLIEALKDGFETDAGSLIEFRAKKGGPVLARIELKKAPPRRLVEKFGGEETGWTVDLAVSLPDLTVAYRVYPEAENHLEAWESTSPALAATFADIAALAEGAGAYGDVLLLREWAEAKRVKLGGTPMPPSSEFPAASAWAAVATSPIVARWRSNPNGLVFESAECISIEAPLKIGAARVLLARRTEGWAEAFVVSVTDSAAAFLPTVEGTVYPTVSGALIGGVQGILTHCGNLSDIPAKQRKPWNAIGEWALELLRDAGDMLPALPAQPNAAAELVESDESYEASAALIEQRAQKPADEAESEGMTKCPKCGVWCTVNGLEPHMAQCEAAQ